MRNLRRRWRQPSLHGGATVLATNVEDPERFGVVEFDEDFNVLSLEEKPDILARTSPLTGLYFYDSRVCDSRSG